jgi:hypothetical protein
MAGALNIIEAMTDPALFQGWFAGETWDGWRTILKAAYCLPMDEAETEFFRTIAERDPPTKPVRELWCIVGRRGGKDSVASVIAAHSAALFSEGHRLRPGERALVACLAVDRDQSKVILNYTRSYFADIDLLKGMIQRETATGFELSNNVDVSITTNSFRSVRGRPILCAILDETAFWRDENSATPDEETYKAIKPALASIPGSIIIGISSPYRKSGLLYKKFREHYGKNGDVLVIKAPTRTLNPTIDQAIVDEAMAEDPAAASAEWMAEFRDDIAAFVTREAVDACISPDVLERSRIQGVKYTAFVDPSGGSSDSMTLAIGHSQLGEDRKRSVAVLDAVREIRAPFSPDDAVAEFATLLKSYSIRTVRGDRYAAEWVTEAFKKAGIEYRPADLSKSEIYRDFLPRLNSGEVDLLDNPRMVSQLLSLERRTARGGRDSIDHPPGGKDDLINAAAGCCVYLTSARHQVYSGPLSGTYVNGFVQMDDADAEAKGFAKQSPEFWAAQGVFHPLDRQKWIDRGIFKPEENSNG